MIIETLNAIEETLQFMYDEMSEKEQHAFDLGEAMGRVRAAQAMLREPQEEENSEE